MEMAKHSQNSQMEKYDKQNFTAALKYFSVTTVIVFYCDTKHSDIYTGAQSCLLLLVF